MKFLADAHVSTEMIAMIRDLGHDGLNAAAIPPRMLDVDVLRMAADQERVVITADKDFGELVFVHKSACPGVILVRIALAREVDRVAYMRTAFPTVLTRLPGSFVTVTDHSVRARPLA